MRYTIHTETGSTHEIDTTAMTYVRLRVGPGSMELRRDGEPVPMKAYTLGKEGESCFFHLQIREDGVGTMRSTSPVTKVEEHR